MLAECLLLSASLCATVNEPPSKMLPAKTEASVLSGKVLTRTPAEASPRPVAEPIRADVPRRISWKHDRAYLAFSAGAYAMALVDMTNTARLGREGVDYIERNPIARPFVKHPFLHYTSGLAAVTGANWVSWKLKHSSRWRKLWWLPQVVSIGLNTWGYAASVH